MEVELRGLADLDKGVLVRALVRALYLLSRAACYLDKNVLVTDVDKEVLVADIDEFSEGLQ